MADNVVANAGSGGATFRAILKSSIDTPVSVIDIGGSGAENLLTAGQQLAANSIPIVLTAAQMTTLTPLATVGISAGSAVIGHIIVDSGTVTTVAAVTAITNALPAGTNVIGHVIADTGSTTAVTGNVTVVQPTGTNLHAVVDSGTITTVSAVTAITNALPAGSNVIGHVIADTGSTTAVTQATGSNLHMVVDSGTVTTVSTVTAVTAITNALPAGTNTIGGVTTVATATSSGMTTYERVSTADNNADTVKASAGQVYSIQAFNINAAARYLKFYNKATNPAPGSDTVIKSILIPGNTAGAGVVMHFTTPIPFSTGIAIACVGGLGNTDNTSISATEVLINIDYK